MSELEEYQKRIARLELLVEALDEKWKGAMQAIGDIHHFGCRHAFKSNLIVKDQVDKVVSILGGK
jgi:hypothetical protein